MRFLLLPLVLLLAACFTFPADGPDPARQFIPHEVKDSTIFGKHSGWPSHCPPEQHDAGWC